MEFMHFMPLYNAGDKAHARGVGRVHARVLQPIFSKYPPPSISQTSSSSSSSTTSTSAETKLWMLSTAPGKDEQFFGIASDANVDAIVRMFRDRENRVRLVRKDALKLDKLMLQSTMLSRTAFYLERTTHVKSDTNDDDEEEDEKKNSVDEKKIVSSELEFFILYGVEIFGNQMAPFTQRFRIPLNSLVGWHDTWNSKEISTPVHMLQLWNNRKTHK